MVEGIWDVERGAWAGQASWKHPAPYTPSTRPPGQPFAGPWAGRVGNPAYSGDPNYRGDACGNMHFNAKTHNVVNPNRDNMAVFGLFNGQCANCVGTGHGILGAARLSYGDYDTPLAQVPVHTNRPPETQWVSRATPTVRLDAREPDPGLGIHQTALYYPRRGGPIAGTHDYRVSSPNCDGGNRRPCPASFNATIGYDTNNMDEGVNEVFSAPYDPLGKYPANYPRWTTRVDRSPPSVTLSDELATLDLNDSGRDSFDLHIEARDGSPGGTAADRRSGVASVTVLVDGQVEEVFEQEADCGTDSCPLTEDYMLDTDLFPQEGSHTVGVYATDKLGQRSPTRTLTIRVPRENYYAGELATWKADVERRVDDAVPAVPLSGSMPAVPDRWRDGAACEATAAAMRACYDAGTSWGRQVRDWLQDNLATTTGAAAQLPDPPTFRTRSPSAALS